MKRAPLWAVVTPVAGFAVVGAIAFGIGQLLLFTHHEAGVILGKDTLLYDLTPVFVALVIGLVIGGGALLATTVGNRGR